MDGEGIKTIIKTAAAAAFPLPAILDGPGFKQLAVPVISNDGATREWTFRDLPFAAVQPPQLVVHTLSGFVDYVKANRDVLDLTDLTAHVVSPEEVNLFGSLSQDEVPTRMHVVRAAWAQAFNGWQSGGLETQFGFGKWLDPEIFLIGLQVNFEQSDERTKLLQIVSNLRNESVKTWEDDGISQSVAAGTGVKLGKEVPLPNPIWLRPWRTFRDIAQPASRYVLRGRGNNGQTPQLALFEAEGARWRFEAIQMIAEFLRAKLPDSVVVIA